MTLRVHLEPITPADTAAMLGAGPRPGGWADDYPTPDAIEVAGFLDAGTLGYATNRSPWGAWFVIDGSDGAVVGDAGFHGPPDEDGAAEIGYNVAPSRRGRGLATAVVALLIDIAARAGATAVSARTDADNLPSQRVLDSNGFAVVAREADQVVWSRSLTASGEDS